MSEGLRVNRLIDYVYGKEHQLDDVGATARFIRSHVGMRPALEDPPRWPSLDALKTQARHYGPGVTPAQIDVAIAEAGV